MVLCRNFNLTAKTLCVASYKTEYRKIKTYSKVLNKDTMTHRSENFQRLKWNSLGKMDMLMKEINLKQVFPVVCSLLFEQRQPSTKIGNIFLAVKMWMDVSVWKLTNSNSNYLICIKLAKDKIVILNSSLSSLLS